MTQKLVDHIALTGVILCTEKFEECVAFYNQTLGLPIWFQKDHLVCLHFGPSYLMIETQGVQSERKNKSQNPVTLRFNAHDLDAVQQGLDREEVQYERKSFEWGEVITFWDPDGNECEVKNADDPYFE